MSKNVIANKGPTYTKILFLVLVALLIGIPTSGSYFFNKEQSSQNELESTVLDIELDPDDNFDPDQDISPGETQSRDFEVLNLGQNGFPYKIRTDNLSGDPDLCDALEVNLIFHDGSSSSGNVPLDTLDFDVSSIEDDDSFTLEVTLPEDADDPELGNSTCNFDLVADIWVEDLSPGQAYFDTESFANQITTGSFMEQMESSQPDGLQMLQAVPESTESE